MDEKSYNTIIRNLTISAAMLCITLVMLLVIIAHRLGVFGG